MKKIAVLFFGIFIIGFSSLIIILKIRGLSLKKTPRLVIKATYSTPITATKGNYKSYRTLIIDKPIEKEGKYLNPFTKNVLTVDRSMANRCCEQPSYTFYIDGVDNVFWIGYYQASLVNRESGTFGPFQYTNILNDNDRCIDSDQQCQGKQDKTVCTVGVWCDEEGNTCGGNSCTGIGLGECYKEKCVIP